MAVRSCRIGRTLGRCRVELLERANIEDAATPAHIDREIWSQLGETRGVFGTLLSPAWLVPSNQALAGQAKHIQAGSVWLPDCTDPGWCKFLFGYM